MMQVAILAGGLGTRLGPLTAQVPKALVPVNGRPFLAHVLDLLASHGLTRILILHGRHGDQIERTFGDGGAHGVRLEYQHDGPRLLGTGGSLRAALPRLDEELLVLYGDTYLDIDFAAVQAAFRASGKPALMTVFRNGGRFDRSNVVFRGGELLQYDKENPIPEMDYIDYGLSALRREIVAEIPAGEPRDLAGLYQRLVRERRMAGFEVFQRFYEVGTPQGLTETESYLRGRGV